MSKLSTSFIALVIENTFADRDVTRITCVSGFNAYRCSGEYMVKPSHFNSQRSESLSMIHSKLSKREITFLRLSQQPPRELFYYLLFFLKNSPSFVCKLHLPFLFSFYKLIVIKLRDIIVLENRRQKYLF